MKLRVVCIVLGVAILLAIIFATAIRSRPHPPILPSPNGHDALVTARALVVANPGYWRTQDLAELQAVLAPNSNVLATVRGALRKEWAAPISYNTNYLSTVLSNAVTAKILANLFCAEGRVAELEQRTNDALNAFTDCIQLGQKSTYGALMIQDLVGIACKGMGMEEVKRIWPAASDASLRVLFDRLSAIDQSNQDADEIIRRDRDWARISTGTFRFSLSSVASWKIMYQSRERLRGRHGRSEAEIRLLRSDVALELFYRKNGRYPGRLDELIPLFLEKVPSDPFSKAPLIYLLTTNSYLLYSIGPDKKDDNGKPLTRSTLEKGDLVSTPHSRL